MSAVIQDQSVPKLDTDWPELMRQIGPEFAARAAAHDQADSFVADNYAILKDRGAFAAGIPTALGGGGASYDDIAEMLRILGRHCSSTALALSMQTHLVAGLVWRWHRDPKAVEPMLRRIVNERLVLISTGGSDWLNGSGKAEPVEGGWRITGRKIFGSGVPMGDALVTMAVHDDPSAGPTVLHFVLPLKAQGVRVLDTWRAIGMRGTGSHDVAIDGAFVPDAAISVRRPQGKWHMAMHLAAMIAMPLVYSVYLGVAEAARDIAIERAALRAGGEARDCLVGEMEDELALARLARADMVAASATGEPGEAMTNRIMTGRTLAGRASIRTVEKAMEVTGGSAMYRDTGLERLFRDIQGARYHPLQEKAQQRYAGRMALGLGVDG